MAQGSRKRKVEVGSQGRVYIQASFNNIIISVTNHQGDVISWSSAGRMGFKGSKKSTPYAAQVASERCMREAYDMGLRSVVVFVKGISSGRDSAIRTVRNVGLDITNIHDVTPIPHNGCRPAKRRRV